MEKSAVKLCVFVVTLALCFCVSESIQCYDCNSASDPRCADPFNDYSIGKINCSQRAHPEHLGGKNATLCRKTVMKVYGKIRIQRGCGYMKDDPTRDCIKRSGTHDVQTIFCSCDTDFCNSAPQMSLTSQSVFVCLSIITVISQFIV